MRSARAFRLFDLRQYGQRVRLHHFCIDWERERGNSRYCAGESLRRGADADGDRYGTFGKFVFIANSNGSVKPASETISTLEIDGAKFTTSSIIATPPGNDLSQIIVDPSGTFLYASSASNEIVEFAIDPVSGRLFPIPGSPFSAGNASAGANCIARMAIDPSGKFLLVGQHTNSTGPTYGQKVLLRAYQIDANTGVPTPTTVPLLTLEMPQEDLFLMSIAISK
jgi:hypothetical protein